MTESDVYAPSRDAAFLSSVLDALPSLLAYVDASGRNRYANAAIVDWFGLTPEEAFGRHVAELLGPEQYAVARPHLEAALAGEARQFERTLIVEGGGRRHTRTLYLPRFTDGRPDGFHVHITDVSRLVEAEARRAAAVISSALLRQRTALAVEMHDTVLQRLFAAGMSLQRAAGDPGRAPDLIVDAVHQTQEAIEQLRHTIKSLERGSGGAGLPRDAVEQLVSDAASTLGLDFTVENTGDFEGISEELAHDALGVVAEAMTNVVRHAGAHHVEVAITADPTTLAITVVDDGLGIAGGAEQARLTSLRAAAARHGGTVRSTDNLPRGTRIDWSVPR